MKKHYVKSSLNTLQALVNNTLYGKDKKQAIELIKEIREELDKNDDETTN
jgi:hypothetical protein